MLSMSHNVPALTDKERKLRHHLVVIFFADAQRLFPVCLQDQIESGHREFADRGKVVEAGPPVLRQGGAITVASLRQGQGLDED